MRLARFALLSLVLLACFSGCARKPKVSQPSGSTTFETGERYYEAGDYTHAIAAYEESLRRPEVGNRESALFHLAISYSLRAQAPEDLLRAQNLFDILAREYPKSPVAQQAKLVSRSIQLMHGLETARAQEEEHLQRISTAVDQLMQRVGELERDREAQASNPLTRATQLAGDGSFKEAADIYESFLTSAPAGPGRQEALFRLALLYLTPDTGLKDNRAALALLDKLTREAPTSPYAAQARYLTSVHRELFRLRGQVESQQAELKQLNQELRALKAIDLKRR